jgi:hypothetical protein
MSELYTAYTSITTSVNGKSEFMKRGVTEIPPFSYHIIKSLYELSRDY